MIACDGCGYDVPVSQLAIFAPEGLQVRYCKDCTETWRNFETALNAETARLQAINALFQQDARSRCSLKVVPLDFPRVARDDKGQPVVLR